MGQVKSAPVGAPLKTPTEVIKQELTERFGPMRPSRNMALNFIRKEKGLSVSQQRMSIILNELYGEPEGRVPLVTKPKEV